MSELKFSDLAGSTWASYPKSYAIGHRAIHALFEDEVIVEEKVDGSQFSFGMIDGKLLIKSKNKLQGDNPDKMFILGVDYVESIQHKLAPGYMYTGEYLNKPTHNTLKYERVPSNNIIIFDIRVAPETYLDYQHKEIEANRLRLETVPLLFQGKIDSPDKLVELMKSKSILGDVDIEGIVVKNYNRFTPDGKVVMGKFVSEKFKESHGMNKNFKPGKSFVEAVAASYHTEARFRKAVQHLKEDGTLLGEPKDIGPLIAEIKRDFIEEHKEEVVDAMWKHFEYNIMKVVSKGLPQWYKEQLMTDSMEEDSETN